MADAYVGDSDFTTLVAGDDIDAEPLTSMFDRIKNFFKGSITNATVKVEKVQQNYNYIGDNWRIYADGNTLITEYSTDNFVTILYTDAKVAE